MKTMFIMLVMMGMVCLSGCRCDVDIPDGHKDHPRKVDCGKNCGCDHCSKCCKCEAGKCDCCSCGCKACPGK